MKFFTSIVDPLAASAIMSAQETVLGHASSSRALIWSITSNPLREFLFGTAFFSLTIYLLSSRRTDASQPWNSFVWKLNFSHEGDPCNNNYWGQFVIKFLNAFLLFSMIASFLFASWYWSNMVHYSWDFSF